MDSKQPKPDSKRYTDLINDVEKGVIKVPKFMEQRHLYNRYASIR